MNILRILQAGAILVGSAMPLAASEAGDSGRNSATLRGRISNEATGENLEGANIAMADLGRTARTERDGTYIIRNLPPGPAVLQVSFPGLDPASVSVTLEAGVSTRRDIALTSEVYVLPELRVTGMREGHAAALARQEGSATITNVVATDAYGNIAKGELGRFLRLLPGIAAETGGQRGSGVDSISIRGMATQFTTMTLDGTRAAVASGSGGSGLSNRHQQLGAFSTENLESVEVIKTPTADMDGDSLGGVINLRSKSAFQRQGRAIRLSAGMSYNETFGSEIDPTSGDYIYPQLKFEYSDVFSVFGGQQNLGVVLTASSEEFGEVITGVRQDFANGWDFTPGSTVPRRINRFIYEFNLSKRESLHTNFDYKLSENSTVSLRAGYTKRADMSPRVLTDPSQNLIVNLQQSTADRWVFDRFRTLGYNDLLAETVDQWRYQLEGVHDLDSVRIDWDVSYMDSSRHDDRFRARARSNRNGSFVWDRGANPRFPTFNLTSGVAPWDEDFSDTNRIDVRKRDQFFTNDILGARLDVTKEFEPAGIPIAVKTGARLRQEERSFDEYVFFSNLNNPGDVSDFLFDPGWSPRFADGNYPIPRMIDSRRWNDERAMVHFVPGGVPGSPNIYYQYNPVFAPSRDDLVEDALVNDYWTRETIPAVYLQAQADLTDRLRVTAGIRFEETRTSITTRYENTDATDSFERFSPVLTTRGKYRDWFPNLQFRYEPKSRLIFRAAYSETIGRPGIDQLVDKFSVNDVNQTVSVGNPALLPQHSKNYDLGVEYYFEPVGMVSIGLFRKDLTNFVTNRSVSIITGNELGLDLSDYVGWVAQTRDNIGTAEVEGVELAYSQQFTFLPKYWNGLGVMFNWTVLRTSGDFGVLTGGEWEAPFQLTLDGFRERSGNAGITYLYDRWDVRLMWNYQSDYVLQNNFATPDQTDWRGSVNAWDLFLRYRLSERYDLFLDVTNLAGDGITFYSGLPVTERIAEYRPPSRVFTFGVQARF